MTILDGLSSQENGAMTSRDAMTLAVRAALKYSPLDERSDEIAGAMRAALETAGYVVVPRKATDEMMVACESQGGAMAEWIWDGMIAASP